VAGEPDRIWRNAASRRAIPVSSRVGAGKQGRGAPRVAEGGSGRLLEQRGKIKAGTHVLPNKVTVGEQFRRMA
jgi:hypothetical protein